MAALVGINFRFTALTVAVAIDFDAIILINEFSRRNNLLLC